MADIPFLMPQSRSWQKLLEDELSTPSYLRLLDTLVQRARAGHNIYPDRNLVFRALDLIEPQDVRCIILGQDPYHTPGKAMGLAFSVPSGETEPPSLRNIKQEIFSDLGVPSIIQEGDLTPWVEQGVLLLNTILTVEEGKPLIHKSWGWEAITTAIIHKISLLPQPKVYLLWGSHAQSMLPYIVASTSNLILRAPHPSPLSAHRGFLGSKPFSRVNNFLISHGLEAIQW